MGECDNAEEDGFYIRRKLLRVLNISAEESPSCLPSAGDLIRQLPEKYICVMNKCHSIHSEITSTHQLLLQYTKAPRSGGGILVS
jgi:hypothetical protein